MSVQKGGGTEQEDLVIESVGDGEEFEMKEQPQTDPPHEDSDTGAAKVAFVLVIIFLP